MNRAVLLLAGVLCACASTPAATDAAQTQDTAVVTDVQGATDAQTPSDVAPTDAAATDTAPPVDAAPCLPAGNAARGATAARDTCVSCHGSTLGGGTDRRQPPGANLHNDGAGAGGWTDCDFQRAVRAGVDDEGATLCVDMPLYTTRNLTDQELADIFAYVQTLTTPGIDPGMCE